MISRRALLGSGAAVVVVAAAGTVVGLTHRLDDVARGVGVNPRPRPVASDDHLIIKAANDQNALLGQVEAVVAKHAASDGDLARLAQIGREHVKALGGSAQVPDIAKLDADPKKAIAALARSYTTASTARAKDAGHAVSPDLVRVLSSMSAGLAQCARTVGDL